MGMESKWIWKDGDFVRYEDATLHFLTPGLHYGIGVFEGIRCYETKSGPAVFRLPEHIRRLRLSAKALGFDALPYSEEELIEATNETVARNGFTECYLRPMIWLDAGGWNLNLDGGRPAIGIAAWEWKNYLGAAALEKGVRANVSSYTRHHPNVSMTKAKISGNYVNSFLAKTESERLGFQEAIMLDPQGYVGECTGENLFVVRHGKVITPVTAPVLEGITRHTIFTIAKDLGREVLERPISRDQLYTADEVFVCGTAAECIGLSEIDFRKIGDGKTGPVTREIQNVYHDLIRGRVAKYEEWCEYVEEKEKIEV